MSSLASGSVNQRNSVINTVEIQWLSQLLAQQHMEWAAGRKEEQVSAWWCSCRSGRQAQDPALLWPPWQCHREGKAARLTSPPAGKGSLRNHCLLPWGCGIFVIWQIHTVSHTWYCSSEESCTCIKDQFKIWPGLWPRWYCTAINSRSSLCFMVFKNKRMSHKISMPEEKSYP